jgi:aldehyde:ferredoxin oxidoreductase
MNKKILRINMKNTTACYESDVPEYLHLGGRGLTSLIVSKEVPPTCHPLSSENKIVFAPGLISGSAMSSSNRLSAGAKSPLTGAIKESNSGGTVSIKLAKLGIKGIIIEEKPDSDAPFKGILINKNGVQFIDFSDYKSHKG